MTALIASSAMWAQTSWFNEKDLTITGVYYYPEHWNESQWERDFKKMHELGFEFTQADNERLKGVSRMKSLEILLSIGKIEANAEQKEKWANEKNERYVKG